MYDLICPTCEHVNCSGCVRRTMKLKIGKWNYAPVDSVDGLRLPPAMNLACCSCQTVNIAGHWKTQKIPQSQPRRETYPDLFSDKETKM